MWKPQLFERQFYSELLDATLTITVTMRTLDLIDQAYGFDFYILKVGPCQSGTRRPAPRRGCPRGRPLLGAGQCQPAACPPLPGACGVKGRTQAGTSS